MADDSYAPPGKSDGDAVHTLVRAGISAIPIVGGPAVELFQMLVTPALENRRQQWMETVAEGMRALDEKHEGIVDGLAGNPVFIDTVLQASQAAIRTSQQEKREALRNAVRNSTLPQAPDATRQQIFINWIDSFTEWHLRMLRLFADPIGWYARNNLNPPQYAITSSLSGLLTDAYPELKQQRELYDKLAKDLYNAGLTKVDGLHTMMSAKGAYEMRATDLGNQFLTFITDPTD